MSCRDEISQKNSAVFVDGEMASRGMLGFRSRKPNFSTVKPDGIDRIVSCRKRENDTPADLYLSLQEEAPAQLPEKYAQLETLYQCLEAAISFSDSPQPCSFQTICANIEATTNRCCLQRHLAQMKHIFPEAIDLEYVPSHEQSTHSEGWQVNISLLPLSAEVMELPNALGHPIKRARTEAVQRKRVFRARLAKFASTHSEEDDVPEHPWPNRIFNENLASKWAYPGMPSVTTCIPMKINTDLPRVEIPEVDKLSDGSIHFSRSFRPSFSRRMAKPAICFIPKVKSVEVSSTYSGLSSTVLPMPINKTSHRDLNNEAKLLLGTPHLAPSFRPFFSIPRSIPGTLSASEDRDNFAPISDAPNLSVGLAPAKRQHYPVEKKSGVAQRAEFQIPTKIGQSFGTPQRFSTPVYNSARERPHFTISTQIVNQSSSNLLSTPSKPSIREDVPTKWDLRTPGRSSNAVNQCSPTEGKSLGFETPVKSSRTSMKPSKNHYTTSTSLKLERGDSSVYDSYHAGHGKIRSPAATPVTQPSSVRSLKFNSPESDSKLSGVTGSLKAALFSSPCPGEPHMEVPSTPENPSRAIKFRRKVMIRQSKLDFGPFFARASEVVACS